MRSTMRLDELSSECSCGAVKYGAEGRSDKDYACHCKNCQTRTGSGLKDIS